MTKAGSIHKTTPETGMKTINIAEPRFIPFMQDDEYLFIDYPAASGCSDLPKFPGDTLDPDNFMQEIASVMEHARDFADGQLGATEPGDPQTAPEN